MYMFICLLRQHDLHTITLTILLVEYGLTRDLTDKEVNAFKNQVRAYGLRAGELSRMHTLLEVLDAMETAGVLGINKYDVLKRILAHDMEKPGLLACVQETEADIQVVLLSAGRNEPWIERQKDAEVLQVLTKAEPTTRDPEPPSGKLNDLRCNMQATTSATIERGMQYLQVARNRNSNANCYPSGKGFLLIVNNFTQKRKGTQKDQENLLTIFRDTLNFDAVVKENVTRDQLMNALISVQKLLFTGVMRNNELCHYSSFFLAIMSHGSQAGIKTMDGHFVSVADIVCHFKADRLSTMAGKPKVLLVQACRGPLNQCGVEIQSDDREEEDAQQSVAMTPVDADVLIAYSTTEGYRSWRREEKGSWFIHHVTQTLQHCYVTEHLLDMLTMVNQQV
ncbi:PREDICTED: caspase-3-like isoform X2 [Priapulus caudatus]|nr:PREDICTED: caspase-3-like isoform X2 [Priapulus caudatus]